MSRPLHPAFTAPLLDDSTLDLAGAATVTYRLEQTFRYDYDNPIESLQHRLFVIPPLRHGHLYRRAHELEVTGADTERHTDQDDAGNTVVRITAPRVEQFVEFRLTAVVERIRDAEPHLLPSSALTDPRWLGPTRLTAPDDNLRAMAAAATARGGDPLDVAERICEAVYASFRYAFGVTNVNTTASEALAGGVGVCQDYAHVMVAACRLAGLPARYVSGHLLGQGGTHAWPEVVVEHPRGAEAVGFDPCHSRRANARYIAVASGRDYADVAPTAGTYASGGPGRLSTSRNLGVVSADQS